MQPSPAYASTSLSPSGVSTGAMSAASRAARSSSPRCDDTPRAKNACGRGVNATGCARSAAAAATQEDGWSHTAYLQERQHGVVRLLVLHFQPDASALEHQRHLRGRHQQLWHFLQTTAQLSHTSPHGHTHIATHIATRNTHRRPCQSDFLLHQLEVGVRHVEGRVVGRVGRRNDRHDLRQASRV